MADAQAPAQSDPIDEFIALPRDQQLTTLQGIAPENQDKLLEQVRQRKATPVLQGPIDLKSTVPPAGASTPSPAAPQGNFIQRGLDRLTAPLSDQEQKGLNPVTKTIAQFGQGAAQSLLSPVAHPIQTAEGLYHTVTPDPGTAGNVETVLGPAAPIIAHTVKGIYDQARTQGIPSALGNLAGGVVGGEIGGGILSKAGQIGKGLIGRAARGAAEDYVDTAQATNQKAIEKATTKNEAARASADAANEKLTDRYAEQTGGAQAKADAANLKAVQDRAQELRDYYEKTKAAKDSQEAIAGAKSRRDALSRGVEQLDPQINEELRRTEADVRDAANAKYNSLNTKLNDQEVGDPDLLSNMLQDASETMKGSNTVTPIMKDMQRKLGLDSEGNPITKKGMPGEPATPIEPEPLTFRDLQGYRSEIGSALSKGNLPGDVFHAYKGMMNSIDDAMQDIANKNGMGNALTDARQTWKQYSDTFNDPSSPIRKAIDATERGKTVKAFQGRDSAIEALAKYHPALAERINTIRGYQAEARAPLGTAKPKPLPKPLPPKPEPVTPPPAAAAPAPVQPKLVQPNITKASPQGMAQAKADALVGGGERVRGASNLANALAGYGAVRSLLHGNVGAAAMDLAARGAYSGIKGTMANVLEHPLVVRWLAKPDAADLAQLAKLPPAQRTVANAELAELIKQARLRNLPVAPAVSALVGGVTAPVVQSFHPQVETGSSTPTDTRQFATTKMPDTGDAANSLGVLPDALQRVIANAHIVQGGPATDSSGRPAIASVDNASGNTITIHDPSRMEPQVLAHEAGHLVQNNLAPAIQKSFPKDAPTAYFQPNDIYKLGDLRKRGMTLRDLPEENQSQITQAYLQYYHDPETRAMLQPWMNDWNALAQHQSNILPTPQDAATLVTTPRAPVPPQSAFAPR